MTTTKFVLEDGSVYSGISFGYQKSVAGEVVFSTGMIGYPESLTDPFYKGQILVFKYSLIGNYGMPDFKRQNGLLSNYESNKAQIQGVIVSEYSSNYDHRDADMNLNEWLKSNKELKDLKIKNWEEYNFFH